jgi:hypothetical protein
MSGRPEIEARLPHLLRELPVPDTEGAERRGLAVVTAAFGERAAEAPPPGRGAQRSSPRRLALALALAALLAALLLSPAGASVRHWVGDVFSDQVPKAQPGLGHTPGGGRLLVLSQAGPWVVQPDGSRRLLGDYGDATWSPNGLYLAVAAGRTLTAVEPDGTPHWSLTAQGPVSDPRWWPGKYRIAYRAGSQLWVTAADGTEDHLVARGMAPVAPVWSPTKLLQLAYVEGGAQRPLRLAFAEAESGERLGSAPALPSVFKLEWGESGRYLLEASRAALRLRLLRVGKLEEGIGIKRTARLRLPQGARVEDASLAPHGGALAAVVRSGHGNRVRSSVLVYWGAGAPRRLLTVPGRLGQVVFSPNSRRLLVAWPDADEWLFLPLTRGRAKAVGDVSAAFAPGHGAAAFPYVAGWCCPNRG